jgi:hypothetical protein
MASGLARFLVRRQRLAHEARASGVDFVSNWLNLKPVRDFSLVDVQEAAGSQDVVAILALAHKLSPIRLNLSEWVNARNHMGESALLLACKTGRRDVLLLLRQSGGQEGTADFLGRTCADFMGTGGFSRVGSGANPWRLADVPSKSPLETRGGWGGLSWLDDPTVQSILQRLEDVASEYRLRGMPSVREIAWPEFQRTYLSVRPLLIRLGNSRASPSSPLSGWGAFAHWTRDQFVARYGKLLCESGRVPYSQTYGRSGSRLRLEVLVAKMAQHQAAEEAESCGSNQTRAKNAPLYAFDSTILEGGALAADVNVTSVFESILGAEPRLRLKQFALGPRLSGSQPHFHGDALNIIVYGAKLWLLFPPACSFFSNKTAFEFFSGNLDEYMEIMKRENVHCTCYVAIQRQGDALYVPESWGHAVLNLEAGLGVAFEFVPVYVTAL